MTNLATIATETAERIPDAIAYKLDDTEVNWQAVDEGSARVADAEERGRLWPLLVESYPGFGTYQGRTEREIPVVILAPRR